MNKDADGLVVEVKEDQLALKLDEDTDGLVTAEPEKKAEKQDREPVVEKTDDALEALKAQVAQLQRERDEANRQRDEDRRARLEAESDAKSSKARAQDNERSMIDGYIAAAKTKADNIKAAIREASASGDHERVAELNMEAARVAARQLQYEDAKASIEEKAKRAEVEPPKREEVRSSDPIDTLQVSEPSKNWLRQHRECVTDSSKNAHLMRGHWLALGQGIQPDTPEYFEHLDIHMGYKQAPAKTVEDEGETEEVEAKPERRAMPSAPVSRENARGGAIQPGKVRLSREQVDMAEALGMTPTEYATYMLKVEREGRYVNH